MAQPRWAAPATMARSIKAMVGGGGGAIYSFAHQPGDYPYGTLTNVGGILYGTTSGGGRTNAGTVFSIFPQ